MTWHVTIQFFTKNTFYPYSTRGQGNLQKNKGEMIVYRGFNKIIQLTRRPEKGK